MKFTRGTDPAVKRLAHIAVASAVLIVLGFVLASLLTPWAGLLILLGAVLLFFGPLFIAAIASRALREQDHKVDGRTFVVDLFRSVRPPESQPEDRPDLESSDDSS